MQDVQKLPELKVPKIPFFVGDAIMLGLAYYIYYQGKLPLSHWELGAMAVVVTVGAVLGIMPYLLEYRAVIKYGALVKLIETSSLCAATEKIQNLETCVAQISSATDHLQTVQTQADKTANLANEITERMATEVREFTAFMQKANDGEKSTLRLEVEKLRRSETEWLQVLVFMLDHIYALNRAAERSGQENLIAQLRQFQNSCRDAARRVGLVPVVAAPGEAFDATRHQLAEGQAVAGALIEDVMVCGYSFQGKLVRPVMVKLRGDSAQKASAAADASEEVAAAGQTQLPLGSAESPAV